MNSRVLISFAALIFCSSTNSQTFTLTNTQTGLNNIALGYEVPEPIDSLTPVIGFRSYESLFLRHSQMSQSTDYIEQMQIGSTINNRPIYAYKIGDSDNQMISGGSEGSALINSGIHAREWQTPEATTAYIEHLFDNQTDQHVSQYLLENLTFVVIPVLNVDGFLQTQRFPTQVTDNTQSPRDGRLRRKNMRDVDEDLNTASDNLRGIDLNRNNNPYWATSTRSESDTNSIVHHGASAASEPETEALQQGAILAGEDRLRFYIDTHSFSQIYFSPRTNNSRRNAINDSVANIMRAANNFKYRYGPSAAGSGIGSTDEYFANTYQSVSYTLEIEPLNSAAEYGGFGVSHDGFILPSAEVPRMRQETTAATMAGLYAITDLPFLNGIEIRTLDNQTLIFSASWVAQAASRTLQVSTPGPLLGNTDYVVKLIFNKPMRAIANDQVAEFGSLSGINGVTIKLVGQSGNTDVEYDLNMAQGNWLATQGFSRYKADTYEVPLTLPSGFDWATHSLLALSVATTDMVGQSLDTNPATIVDWQTGAWLNYEDTGGATTTDAGGVSVALRLIDDGSDLYPTANPTPTPTPNPPSSGGSGGGGSLLWLGILLVLGLVRRAKSAL